MRRRSPDVRHTLRRNLSEAPSRPDSPGSRSHAFSETMSYLDLLRLAAPEAVLVVTALVVLVLGLASTRALAVCSAVAAAGLLFASSAVLMLPVQATLFNGMLVITPLTSLFKIVCLALAFFTVIVARQLHSRHHGEYLALLLLATVGPML